MKHRWRHTGTKGDSVWKHMTWRCARCHTQVSVTVHAEVPHEPKHRPRGDRTYGAPPDCTEAIVLQVHKL